MIGLINFAPSYMYATESLNFSKPARSMHLFQPAVSHRIKSLKLDIGVKLLDCIGSELQLTEAGRILEPWARKLIRQAIEMQETMDSLQHKIVGFIRISCSKTTGKIYSPNWKLASTINIPGSRSPSWPARRIT